MCIEWNTELSILQKPLKYTIIMWEYTEETRHHTASTRLLYSGTQILALVLLMSTQNPLVLMSTRGIF